MGKKPKRAKVGEPERGGVAELNCVVGALMKFMTIYDNILENISPPKGTERGT